jgi:hypothetical protein
VTRVVFVCKNIGLCIGLLNIVAIMVVLGWFFLLIKN